MKYYLDTEFIEGPQDKTFLGFKYGKTKPTIDLISIGLLSEDGREYYAISKDFNLKQAWKNKWIRDNVLRPIHKELCIKEKEGDVWNEEYSWFSFKSVNYLINTYGKTTKQISENIKEFVYNQDKYDRYNGTYKSEPEFYAYYADYDWVVFCQLFGRMIDLPKGFPMYCKDLKQMLDEKVENIKGERSIYLLEEKRSYGLTDISYYNEPKLKTINFDRYTLKDKLKIIKENIYSYPKQKEEHNALEDAKWNNNLHEFIKNEKL